ncbi:hypothetical protein BC830DRAFT_1077032 [Chytriomyces sp. MP71]|nr:hypothetical protein BC830DRAFT_1077032 [Chytriomyces sp. MP71]
MLLNALVTITATAVTVLATKNPNQSNGSTFVTGGPGNDVRDRLDGDFFGLNNPAGAPVILHKSNTARSMTQPMNLYIIWYGSNWSADSKSIVTDFLSGLGQSDFWSVEQKYYQGSASKPVYVTGDVKISGQYDDAYSLTKTLNSGSSGNFNDVATIIQNAVDSNNLPSDKYGFYLVLGDDQTVEGASCSEYCGYHTSTLSDRDQGSTIAGDDLVYTYIGNPTACGLNGILGCGGQTFNSPNGNPGVDAMLSPIAHELAEGGSNPDTSRSAWNNADGYENGDNCAYIFGSKRKYDVTGGFYYNQEWNGRKYQIQQLWDPTTQLCGAYYPALVSSECDKLHAIFPSLNFGNDCCNSGYADCADGHIDAIDVRANGISGDLTTIIGKIQSSLPNIKRISLGNIDLTKDTKINKITGTIPTTLCSMTQLEALNFALLTGVTGSIPSCFSSLVNLQILSLNGAGLSGAIPDVFGGMTHLKRVKLQGNKFTGALPASLGASITLSYLNVNGNAGLSGSVPSGFTGFKGLSVGPTDKNGAVQYCDFTKTALCLPSGYSGPTCGLTSICPKPVSSSTLSKSKTTSVPTTSARASTTIAPTCNHSECTAGALLNKSCSACATAVCNNDSYCCTNQWDSQCVSEVATYCSIKC